MIHFLFQKFLVGHCPSLPDPAAAYGHERPKLKIISASKAEIKKKMAQICCL